MQCGKFSNKLVYSNFCSAKRSMNLIKMSLPMHFKTKFGRIETFFPFCTKRFEATKWKKGQNHLSNGKHLTCTMTDERSPNGHVLITNRAHTINIENGKILTVTSWQTQLSRPFLSLARYLSVCLLISVANCGVRNIELSIFMGIFKLPASHRQISLSFFVCLCVYIFIRQHTKMCTLSIPSARWWALLQSLSRHRRSYAFSLTYLHCMHLCNYIYRRTN